MNLQKIKKLIQTSALSVFEQEELISLFSSAKDEDLKPVLELFLEDKSWIRNIYNNYAAKKAANIAGDAQLWEKIVKTEEIELKEIERQN